MPANEIWQPSPSRGPHDQKNPQKKAHGSMPEAIGRVAFWMEDVARGQHAGKPPVRSPMAGGGLRHQGLADRSGPSAHASVPSRSASPTARQSVPYFGYPERAARETRFRCPTQEPRA